MPRLQWLRHATFIAAAILASSASTACGPRSAAGNDGGLSDTGAMDRESPDAAAPDTGRGTDAQGGGAGTIPSVVAVGATGFIVAGINDASGDFDPGAGADIVVGGVSFIRFYGPGLLETMDPHVAAKRRGNLGVVKAFRGNPGRCGTPFQAVGDEVVSGLQHVAVLWILFAVFAIQAP
jgi:hypothetical protein